MFINFFLIFLATMVLITVFVVPLFFNIPPNILVLTFGFYFQAKFWPELHIGFMFINFCNVSRVSATVVLIAVFVVPLFFNIPLNIAPLIALVLGAIFSHGDEKIWRTGIAPNLISLSIHPWYHTFIYTCMQFAALAFCKKSNHKNKSFYFCSQR